MYEIRNFPEDRFHSHNGSLFPIQPSLKQGVNFLRSRIVTLQIIRSFPLHNHL